MMYILLSLFLIGTLIGVLSVVTGPSPYFAAFGLVGLAGAGCLVLWAQGAPFMAIVLLLIYLGGMLVVFAYSVALAADKYPEAWGGPWVFWMAGFYLVLILGAVIWTKSTRDGADWMLSGEFHFEMSWHDAEGAGSMYVSGGDLLAISAWVLLLTLFVVMCVSWGRHRGGIREV